MSLNQWDFRMVDAGVRVELLDFTDSGERFVFYSNTGEIVSWSLKHKRFDQKLYKLEAFQMPWSMMRATREDKVVIGYSSLL